MIKPLHVKSSLYHVYKHHLVIQSHSPGGDYFVLEILNQLVLLVLMLNINHILNQIFVVFSGLLNYFRISKI